MARIFIDGFEAGDVKLWDLINNATAAAPVSGMDGSYCLDVNALGEYAQKTVPEKSEYYAAFLYQCTQSTNLCNIIAFRNGTTVLGWVRFVSGSSIRAYRGSGISNVLADGATPLIHNTTYLIEVRYKPHSTGVFQVKVNGLLEIDYSGNTTPGAATITNIRLAYYGVTPYYGAAYYDNFILDDADWPGNTKIQAIVPTGAGNSTQWTPSAGANYECVDEVPPSEADYVATNTIGHLDQFAAGNLVGTIGSVKCVQVQALAKTDGAPTPTNLQLAVRSGSADYLSGDKAVPSASKQLWNLWETDPATAAAWSESGVNAMEIGVKAVA